MIFWFYRGSFQSYFEGDEWVFFRFYAPSVASKLWFIQGFLDTFTHQKDLNVHMSPIANMIYVIQYKLFQLNFSPYLIFSISTHVFNSILLAILVFTYSKKRSLAMASALIFATLSTHSQAITWVVASVYTQLSLAFGLLSLIFIKKYQIQKKQLYYLGATIFLLFSLWSKETGLVFLLLFPFLRYKKSLKNLLLYFVVWGIFVFTQNNLLTTIFKSYESVSQPLLYRLLDFWETKNLDLFLIRSVTFSLKVFAQSFIPTSILSQFGEWLTSYLFPYFIVEKSVRGTNYLMFIQTAVPEFLSLGLGLTAFSIWKTKSNILPKSTENIRKLSVILIILGVIPILAVALRFPWWAYTAIIDSRHLYHITPFISILIAEFFLYAADSIAKKNNISPYPLLFLFLIMMMKIQYSSFEYSLKKQQTDSSFHARKTIVEAFQSDIQPVPKKLVLYTTSNKSYYGFAQWMLPFQTAVSHMLPVIFSELYNPAGQSYPPSFFNKDYLKDVKGGLVTQGYFEENGYGLGYFLEDDLLIKTMELQQLPIESLFAFNYDGDTDTVENITEEKRKDIAEILDSRKIFSNWNKYNNPNAFLTFQYPYDWNVEADETSQVILIKNSSSQIVSKVYFQNDMSSVNFAEYVQQRLVNARVIGKTVKSGTLSPDLDISRIFYTPEWNENIIFIASGNGRTIYRIEISPQFSEDMKLLFRTFDFED